MIVSVVIVGEVVVGVVSVVVDVGLIVGLHEWDLTVDRCRTSSQRPIDPRIRHPNYQVIKDE